MRQLQTAIVGSGTVLALALGLVGLSVGFATGDETALQYRRILVPADAPSTWSPGGETLFPIESREFDAWVAAANEPPSTAGIEEAAYEVRLADNQLVDGRGSWHVVLHGDHPARLAVGETSLVFRDVRWRGDRKAPARLGWWPKSERGSLAFALEVPLSGELEFSWRVKSAAATGNEMQFPLRLPLAARTRLTVDVPARMRPVLSNGIVLQSPEQPEDGGRWVMTVAPSAASVLRFEDLGRTTASREVSSAVREELRYTVCKRGIELDAKLRLDANGPAALELNFSLPTGMQLISAMVGDKALKWRVTSGERATSPRRATIELPTMESRKLMTVALRAWSPLVIDERFRLPMLSVDNAFWTSGTLELLLEDSLELRELAPIECSQSAAEAGQGPGERVRSLRFAAFSPSAAVDLSLAHRQVCGSVRMGTTLEIGNPGVVGRLVAEVSVAQRSLHKLAAELRPGWSLVAVETVPAHALGEWYIDRSTGRQVFVLQLDGAVTADQPVKVIVTARKSGTSPREPLPLESLIPLAWSGLEVERSLLQLRAGEQYELEVVGPLSYLAANDLAATERELFPTPTDGLLCDPMADTANVAIRLALKKGDYNAAIQVDASLSQGRLRQTYHIDCRPIGSGIDHVLVYLSEPPSEPLRWTEAVSHEPLVAERMPAGDPRLGGLPPGGELWRLELRRLYARPIAITTVSSVAWPERHRLPLISLPDAATQQGRVSVSSAGNEMPAIVARGMSPAPLPSSSLPAAALPTLPGDASADPSIAVRAIYRFQPTRFYDAGPAPELWLGPPLAARDGTELLATHVDVESRIAADGSGVHLVSYQLENHGANSVELELPPDVRLEAARVDGQPVATLDRKLVSFPLSTPRFNTLLELELSSRYPPLARVGRLPSPLPTGSISIFDGLWNIQLPAGFKAIDETPAAAGTFFDWRERLFGPLARRPGESPFNPLFARDWNLLWAELSRMVTPPAEAAVQGAEGESTTPPGWHSYQLGFVAIPPGGITIVHVPTTRAATLAIFLLCAAGATLFSLRTRSLLMLAVITAAISLLVSTTSAPLFTAATLGFLAATLWQWMRQLLGATQPVATLILLMTVCSPTSSHAAPPPVSVERVLVPVDSTGKQVGSKYFVGPEFLRQLISAATHKDQGVWLITDMHCEGELIPRKDQAGLRSERWVLTLELEVLARDTVVRLPLVKQQAEWAAAASLDGMPATIDWDPSGHGCAIHVAEPGHRRMSISFVPHIEPDGSQRKIEVKLPPLTGAAVQIVGPAGSTGMQGGDRRFSQHDDPNRTVWQSELDASGLFSMRWTATAVAATSGANRLVDELVWLQVARDALTIDARYKLHSSGEWPSTIDVAIVEDWELLTVSGARAEDEPQTQPDGRQMLHLNTASVTDDDRQIVLRFRARDRSPLGRLRLPAIGLQSLPVENRWLAVSVDPALECVPSITESAATISLGEFAGAWPGSGDLAPQMVLSRAKLDPIWYLAVRLRAELSSCRDRLSLAADKHRLRVDYCSEITPAAMDRFGWSLNVPADLEVQGVSIISSGESIPLDWVRESPTRLHIYYAESIANPFELTVVGDIPSTTSGRIPLPRISPAGQLPTTQTVALYRNEDVLASCHFPEGKVDVDHGTSPASPFESETRFVRAFSIDSSASGAVEIEVRPNRPLVQGDTLTTVSRDNGIWMATLGCDLHVEQGELDVLSLEIPASWAGPFDVTPAATTHVAAPRVAGEPAILSVRLPQSVRAGDTVKFQVRSPLALADGELPTAPRIDVRTPGKRTKYLSLPRSLDDEQAAWTRVGVEPSVPPPSLQTATTGPDSPETFRISADSFSVALRPREARAAFARVRLAETVTQRDSKGGEYSATRFIIAPAGHAPCVVALPAGDRMVRATLDGHSALIRSLDERHWQVQLGPPNLPQTLDVVTRAVNRSGPTSRQLEMRRPVLEQSGRPIPVDLSLWTLYQPQSGGAPRVTGGAPVTPAELAATRLDQLVNISQSATRSVIELPLVDGYHWFAGWTAGLDAAEKVASSLKRSAERSAESIRVPQQADDSVPQRVSRSDAWTEQVAEIFAAAGMAVGPLELVARAAFDPWQDAASGNRQATCFISDGDQDQLLVEWVPDGITAVETRFAGLATLAAVALATYWLVRRPVALELLENWPEAVGVLLGLSAWVWLRPSLVGLLVAGVSLLLLVRRYQRERKSPRHDSTSQTSSIPKEMA